MFSADPCLISRSPADVDACEGRREREEGMGGKKKSVQREHGEERRRGESDHYQSH